MSINKSKIKSIQNMWKVMQELATKRDRTELEETTLKICTEFFICSDDFIVMFEDCLEALEEGAVLVKKQEPTSTPQPESRLDSQQESMAMFTGMAIAGITPTEGLLSHHHVDISSSLENQQIAEFHEMMKHLDK